MGKAKNLPFIQKPFLWLIMDEKSLNMFSVEQNMQIWG